MTHVYEEPLKNLADAIAAGELDATACWGGERRGVWSHQCPTCGKYKPAFALVDVRQIDPITGFLCDPCYTHIERHMRGIFEPL